MATTTVTLGDRSFVIDEDKAHEAYAAKKVINGRDTMFFNILPLKYQWAYELYRDMKNNHWEPEDVALRADAAQWGELSDEQQLAVQMLVGYQAISGDVTGAEEIYAIRDIVTAPELKLVFGRYVHEQNTQQDVLVYVLSSLGLNPTTCTRVFAEVAENMKELVAKYLVALDRSADMTVLENKQALARNTFLFSQCMEGLQFYSLYAVVIEMGNAGKLVGVQKLLTKLLRDTSFRCELFRKLFSELTLENRDIRTDAFDDELVAMMHEAVELEKAFIAQHLPAMASVNLDNATLGSYIDYVAARRLAACGLGSSAGKSPLPELDEIFFSAANHHVGHTTSSASSVTDFDDDDL